MSKLLPYLNQGVMVGSGAIFNFYAGKGFIQRAPAWMLSRQYEWLYRALEHPAKNIPEYWRFMKILPRLIRQENEKKNLKM